MPENYDGNASGHAAHEQVTIPCPVGTDAPNAASVNNPLQALADALQYLATNAALRLAIETARFDGPAGDGNAALQCAGAITVRKLILALTYPTRKVRIYQTAAGELEITYNAAWNSGGNNWLADSITFGARALDVSRVVVGATGFKVYRPSIDVQTGIWADEDWELVHSLADDGHLRWILTSTDDTGSNPARTVAHVNELKAKSVPKAFGSIKRSGGNLTKGDGFNVADMVINSDLVQVTFPTGGEMQSADYVVVATPSNFPALDSALQVVTKTTSGFTLAFMKGGSIQDLDATTWGVDFVVFGRQDS